MYDLEGNIISLAKVPNSHILTVGRSGQGKTFWCMRKIEEEFKKNNSVLVFDHSYSYTDHEMRKVKFKYIHEVTVIQLDFEDYEWMINVKEPKVIIEDLRDSLVSSLRISSYYQKKLLEEALNNTLDKYKQVTIPLLLNSLEKMLVVYEFKKAEKENICHLLTRLYPFESIKHLHFSVNTSERERKKHEEILIIQLSNFSEIQRKFLTGICLEMYWREQRRESNLAKVVLLDEFQNLNINSGSAISGMLREGRKFGLSVILSSQFVSNYKKTEIETLLQVGNLLAFKPTDRDLKFIAKIIEHNAASTWIKILSDLRIGEAVVKGGYYLNNNTKIVLTPIICKV